MGFLGASYPEDVGGSGGDWWYTAVWGEELVRSNCAGVNMALAVQSTMATPIINEIGTREQKDEFLVPALKGDKIAALGVSEPNCGSDVASIRTTARKVGGDYVINGAKCWITNGTRADFITLAVRTGDEGYGGISLVLFPTDAKGFKVARKIDKAGNHASDTAELSFEDCRIPARYLLGEENARLLLHHDQLPGRAAHRRRQGGRRRAVGARQHHPLHAASAPRSAARS